MEDGVVFENVDVSTSEGQVNLADELSTENNVIPESAEIEQSKSATSTASKRAHSDGSGSGSGLSPLCKRTFSLDGKDISFENDPWYVGWLFSALDAMKTEFRYVTDMIAGHEAFKVQTNERITTLEREKDEIAQRVSVLEAEKADDRREIHALKSALEERKKESDDITLRLQSFRSEWSQRSEEDAYHLTQIYRDLDRQEQYSSRECLVIHGLPEKKTPDERRAENTDALCIEEIGSRLNVALSPDDINRSHRLGVYRFGSNNTKPRPIILKLVSHNKKNEIYRKKKLLKNSGIIITERLTSRRARFLRFAQEKCGKKNVWTSDGELICKFNPGQSRGDNMTDKFYSIENSIVRYFDVNVNGPDPGWPR